MSTEDPYLVKLVRDRVADSLVNDEHRLSYAPIPDRDAAIKLLRGKLVEEAVEYLLDPSVGELADVQEAIDALMRHDPALGEGGMRAMLAVKREQKRKREQRGGFDGLVGMYAIPVAADG